MIVIKDKEVQVTRKIDNSSFKEMKILSIIGVILSLLVFTSFKLFGLSIFIISLIMFIISEYFYKKENPEKTVLSFSKENLTLYLNNKEIIINTSKIINFSYITNSNNVRINFINEKGKKKSIPLNLGKNNAYDFTIMANNLIDNNFSNIQTTEDNLYLADYKSEEEIFDNLKKGNTVLAKLIGKTKLLAKNGNNYNLERISSLVFITKELVIFYIQIPELKIDFSQIQIGCDYLINYSDISKFSVTLSNSQLAIDKNDMKKIKNTLEIKNNTLFDEEKIKQELELEKKYVKNSRIFIFIIFTGFFLIPIVFLLKKDFIKTCINIYYILFIGDLIYLVIMIFQMKKKCMKLYK